MVNDAVTEGVLDLEGLIDGVLDFVGLSVGVLDFVGLADGVNEGVMEEDLDGVTDRVPDLVVVELNEEPPEEVPVLLAV